MLHEFIDFQWNQRTGGDDGDVLRPTLAQSQAGAFDKKQRRIEKSSSAQFSQFVLVDIGDFFEEQRDVSAVRIDAQQVQPVLKVCREVVVEQVASAEGDGQ